MLMLQWKERNQCKMKSGVKMKEQIFISIKDENGNYYNKDIKNSTYDERYQYYLTLSKGAIVGLFEQVLKI